MSSSYQFFRGWHQPHHVAECRHRRDYSLFRPAVRKSKISVDLANQEPIAI
ncbi:hypothetical protein [Lysobacter gummosus]|uniref:hypothetical protein n=1 Tax=Lysobacter gummosus TaxID=262324 RepID=UPI00362C2504